MWFAILDKLSRSSDMYMPLLALCVYFFLRKKINKRENMLLVYLIINLIFGTVTNVMGFFYINNLFLYHSYTLFEQWFLSYYLLKKIDKKSLSKIYFYLNVSFTAFCVIDIIFWEPLNEFNSITSTVSSILTLFLCMYYMLDLAKKDQILYFQKSPSFWIVSAFLIYAALSILIYAVYNYYVRENLTNEGNEILNVSLYYMLPAKYILISIGLYCYNENKTNTALQV